MARQHRSDSDSTSGSDERTSYKGSRAHVIAQPKTLAIVPPKELAVMLPKELTADELCAEVVWRSELDGQCYLAEGY